MSHDGHNLGIACQFAATPGCKASKRAKQESAVARYEQAIRLAGETLTRGRLPLDSVNAIETKQAELAAQQQIPSGSGPSRDLYPRRTRPGASTSDARTG